MLEFGTESQVALPSTRTKGPQPGFLQRKERRWDDQEMKQKCNLLNFLLVFLFFSGVQTQRLVSSILWEIRTILYPPAYINP